MEIDVKNIIEKKGEAPTITDFIIEEIAKATGISAEREESRFMPKKIRGIPEKYGFEISCHPCNTCDYGKWVNLENESYLLCNMGKVSWILEIENGILVRTGTVSGLEINPLIGNQDILYKIKRDVFFLITNNNGSGVVKITLPFEHRMK